MYKPTVTSDEDGVPAEEPNLDCDSKKCLVLSCKIALALTA